MRNSLAARTLISTPRAGASLTKASIERTTPLICGSQASVTMRMRVNGNAGAVMLGRIWTPRDCTGVWRTSSLVTAHHGEDIQSFSSSFTALAGEEVSFREAAILIFLPRTGWLAWASRNFAVVILNGRPPLRQQT